MIQEFFQLESFETHKYTIHALRKLYLYTLEHISKQPVLPENNQIKWVYGVLAVIGNT